MSLPAISKHLKVLENAGLVSRRRRGREHRLSLEPRGLLAAHQWLEHYREFWEQRLDALDALLMEPSSSDTNNSDKEPSS